MLYVLRDPESTRTLSQCSDGESACTGRTSGSKRSQRADLGGTRDNIIWCGSIWTQEPS